jgi:hypothetical protein
LTALFFGDDARDEIELLADLNRCFDIAADPNCGCPGCLRNRTANGIKPKRGKAAISRCPGGRVGFDLMRFKPGQIRSTTYSGTS